MDNFSNLEGLLGKPESENLEYKAVLPPSRNIAQIICGFANSQGGYIVLGIIDNSPEFIVQGLSDDFHATPITHKAIDLLTPRPNIDYKYLTFQSKKIYAIWVEKSHEPIVFEGKKYIRKGSSTILESPASTSIITKGYDRIKTINEELNNYSKNATNSKLKFIEHYRSVLNIINDLGNLLYPTDINCPTTLHEGKILSRILFSSCVDNFESYLSDILFEIYLAIPETLKSDQTVTVKEVLDCADLQEFISYHAKQKISKLQKGSVKGFITDNKQISNLKVIDDKNQIIIENILQIRHLYSHRNGIIDDKFLKNVTSTYLLNTEFQMPINEISDKICYLAEIVDKLDKAAIAQYNLSFMI